MIKLCDPTLDGSSSTSEQTRQVGNPATAESLCLDRSKTAAVLLGQRLEKSDRPSSRYAVQLIAKNKCHPWPPHAENIRDVMATV
jgi:hypothetical protein